MQDPNLRQARAWFEPMLARTTTIRRAVAPVAYDCVKLIFIREGSVLLYSKFGERGAKAGDVVVLGANISCGAHPLEPVTATTIYLDLDYVLDQIFWRYIAHTRDRLSTQSLLTAIYAEPAQIVSLTVGQLSTITPTLDELVSLSINGKYQERYHRFQALWHYLFDHVSPHIGVQPVSVGIYRSGISHPSVPRTRQFAPLRTEARIAQEMLHSRLAHPWSLSELANVVHLSEKQLVRVFVNSYGKTPLTYLTMLRVEAMAELLRTSEVPVAEAARRVGWASRNRASTAFREYVGMTPTEYRLLRREQTEVPSI